MARLYLGHLSAVQGGIRRLGGLCELRGLVHGRSFVFSAILTFREPEELEMDLLGPLFTPLVRLKLDREGFSMDPIRIEGLDPARLAEVVHEVMGLMRDYLAGRIYSAEPARYSSGWLRPSIETSTHRMVLSGDGHRLESLSAEGVVPLRLDLEEFSLRQGRQIPAQLTATGRGFALGLRFSKLSVDFQ